MPLSRLRLTYTSFLAAAVLLGCGKKDQDTSTPDSDTLPASEEAATQAATPAADPGSGNPASGPVTKDEVGRWEKGLAGELKAVQDAAAKMKTARTGEDSLNAMMGVQETATVAAGARAAEMDQERYKFVRSNLSAVVGYLTPQLGGIDTTMLTPAQRDEMRKGNEAQLQRMQQDVPADVIEAIRPRAVELRKKDLELVAARIKGAGMQ